MPTPTGKPKVGERVQLTDPTGATYTGTVVRRFDGICWGLLVLWDGHKRPTHLGEAQWFAKRGKLKVVSCEETVNWCHNCGQNRLVRSYRGYWICLHRCWRYRRTLVQGWKALKIT